MLLSTLSETSNASAWSSALNGNMYADFLENILNQPKRYESLTVLKEEYVYVADNLSICKD
ncbi:hypothetical protein C0J52_19710 [Blattella germanica]|nr:hypothetical protein C0J52_19710 [Blattella germanica]